MQALLSSGVKGEPLIPPANLHRPPEGSVIRPGMGPSYLGAPEGHMIRLDMLAPSPEEGEPLTQEVFLGAPEGHMIRLDMVAPSPKEGKSLTQEVFQGATEGHMIRLDMEAPSPEEGQSQVPPVARHGAMGPLIQIGRETHSLMVDVSLGPTT